MNWVYGPPVSYLPDVTAVPWLYEEYIAWVLGESVRGAGGSSGTLGSHWFIRLPKRILIVNKEVSW